MTVMLCATGHYRCKRRSRNAEFVFVFVFEYPICPVTPGYMGNDAIESGDLKN